MLGLPSKPWKKIRLIELGGGRYRVMVTSPLRTPEEFKNMVEEKLTSCLSGSDGLEEISWPEKSAVFSIGDLRSFRKRLLFCNIIIEEDEN